MVSGVGLGMGVLDFGGDRRREGVVFGGSEFGASHCNQWGLFDAYGESRVEPNLTRLDSF